MDRSLGPLRPAGWLPLLDQDRLALLASPETRELVHTQRMEYKDNTGEQVFDLYPLEYGRGRVRVTVSCGGSCAEDLREQYASSGAKSLRKQWKEYLKDQFRIHAAPRLEYTPPLDLDKPFHVIIESPDAQIGRFAETTATISLQPDGLFQRLPGLFRGVEVDEDDSDGHAGASSDERKGPLLLPEPHIRQLQYRIHLPAGFTAKSLPDSSLKQFGPATISRKYELSGDDQVVATFRIDTGPGRFTAEEVEDLRQAIAELAKDDSSPWEVKIELEDLSARDMAAGRVAEALHRAQAELARHADRADEHSHYARLLMKAGLGEASRAEARRAVELAPHAASAFADLARLLTYDLLGRQFRPGMDWAGAAAAYEKSLEIDPSDVATRMDYAILLEHDEDGLRYAVGTRLEEAVEQYLKARRQLGPRNRLDQLDANLALALLFSEKYDVLEKLAARSEKSTVWRSFLVAAIAARHGVLDAQRAASEIAADADARREMLRDAGEYLQQGRLYGQAAALYEAAADGSPKHSELLAKAKAIAGLRRMSESELAQDAPRRAVQQLFAAAISGNKDRAKIPAMFVSTAAPRDVAIAMKVLYRAVHPALETTRANQVPPLRIVDAVLRAQVTLEGDAAAGFRLRVSGEQLNDSVWRVVIEQGQARLLPAAALIVSTEGVAAQSDPAWTAVAAGNVSPQVLEAALSAVKQTKDENADCLRTLAAAYAELGNTAEALQNLRRAVELRGERPDGADWYVLGRIAERYGLNEVAAGLYRKVPARQPAAADDAYVLAQRRLMKVGK